MLLGTVVLAVPYSIVMYLYLARLIGGTEPGTMNDALTRRSGFFLELRSGIHLGDGRARCGNDPIHGQRQAMVLQHAGYPGQDERPHSSFFDVRLASSQITRIDFDGDTDY